MVSIYKTIMDTLTRTLEDYAVVTFLIIESKESEGHVSFKVTRLSFSVFHVNSVQQTVNFKALTMFVGARHALLHVTKCSIQKNGLRKRKKYKLQSENSPKTCKILLSKILYPL